MIGRQAASHLSIPRRWLVRFWGYPRVDTRQKWAAVWPHLQVLPASGVSLLDAGCAEGEWSMEIAARRPGWRVTGVDLDEEHIVSARAAATRLGLANVSFERADFLDYAPPTRYDIVLSVLSAHYLAEEGRGPELFSRFGAWLNPGGVLLLLGPRRGKEVPRLRLLPPPFNTRDLFSRDDLETLCRDGALEVEGLTPTIGAAGTLAKQIARATEEHPIARALSYPLQIALAGMDRLVGAGARSRRSSNWLLRASKPERRARRRQRGWEDPCASL